MFTRAIVRSPGKSIINGMTTAAMGPVDYEKALLQHQGYISALEGCDLEVIILDPDENFPDSTFVEDTALLTPDCAIITNPGAPSRQGEIHRIREAVTDFYSSIEEISAPGTVEAGDIMMAGTHFYIGISERTNIDGARQAVDILNRYGMTGSLIHLESVLHLKTGSSYLENNTMAACGEFLENPQFQSYRLLEIESSEAYAANCVWINDRVLVPKGYPKTRKLLENNGYPTKEVDVSEFQKLDGGLSCLSLRF